MSRCRKTCVEVEKNVYRGGEKPVSRWRKTCVEVVVSYPANFEIKLVLESLHGLIEEFNFDSFLFNVDAIPLDARTCP